MTTQCELLPPPSRRFQPVPALPRRFRDAHFAAFFLRRSARPLHSAQRRPSFSWRVRRRMVDIGLLILAILTKLLPLA